MTYKLHTGPVGVCPDCGDPTEVRLAGILDEPPDAPWEVSYELMRACYKGVAKSHKKPVLANAEGKRGSKKAMTCVKCERRTQKFYWAEIVQGGVLGQFCKKCLLHVLYEFYGEKGMVDNIPVYIMPANKKILSKAKATLLLYEPPSEDPIPGDDEVILF